MSSSRQLIVSTLGTPPQSKSNKKNADKVKPKESGKVNSLTVYEAAETLAHDEMVVGSAFDSQSVAGSHDLFSGAVDLECTWAHLGSELANPFDVNNYCFGALLYANAALIIANFFPLKLIVPKERLIAAERIRHTAVTGGLLATHGALTIICTSKLTVGLASGLKFASTISFPLMAVTLTDTAVSLGYWGYHRYKRQHGEAVESITHYRVQQGVQSALVTVGIAGFVGVLTGGLGWIPLTAGLVVGGLQTYRCVKYGEKNGAEKALLAVIQNIEYYNQLQQLYGYIDHCAFKLMTRKPTQSELKDVASKLTVIFVKDEKNDEYFIYHLNKSQKITSNRIYGQASLMQSLNWPNTDANVNDIEDTNIERAKILALMYTTDAPLIYEYAARAKYILITCDPDDKDVDDVKKGKLIIFQKKRNEGNIEYVIHLKDKNNQYHQVVIDDNLKLLDFFIDGKKGVINRKTSLHAEAVACATQFCMHVNLIGSKNHLNQVLGGVFGGVQYNSKQSTVVNLARIIGLYQEVKNAYDLNDINKVLALTNKHKTDKGEFVINKLHQLPPHMAWKILIGYRFMAFAETSDLLPYFRGQYQEYSQYIYNSANEDRAWYGEYWKLVQENLNHALRYGLERFVLAAYEASSEDEKVEYLSNVPQHYNYSKEWYEILNDDLKFWAAAILYDIGKKNEAHIFFRRINDVSDLIRQKGQEAFTNYALVMLQDFDRAMHRHILLHDKDRSFAMDDATLLDQVMMLLQKHKYNVAKQVIDKHPSFKGRNTAVAAYIYETSANTGLLSSLHSLLKETHKDLHYWMMFHNLMTTCFDSIESSLKTNVPIKNRMALLTLIKISIDKIQTHDLPYEQKINIDAMLRKVTDYMRMFIVRINPDINTSNDIAQYMDRFMSIGHALMRDFAGVKLVAEVQKMLDEVAYPCADSGERYAPVYTPHVNEGVFHVFGLSMKEGLKCIQRNFSQRNPIFITSADDESKIRLMNLILDYLESVKSINYARGANSYHANMHIVSTFFTELSESDEWYHDPNITRILLLTLSLVQQKNIVIYELNDDDALILRHEQMLHDSYETINVLSYTDTKNNVHQFIRLTSTTHNIPDLSAISHPAAANASMFARSVQPASPKGSDVASSDRISINTVRYETQLATSDVAS